MKTPSTNLMKRLILSAVLSSPLGLQAQTFLSGDWTQGSPAVTVGVDTNGTLVATAPLNSSVTFNSTETSTSNPQFLWVPALSALRAGTFFSAPSTTTMGQYSAAFGMGTTASGSGSTAFGESNTASGLASAVFGLGNSASGFGSVAFGFATVASGGSAVALGFLTSATGPNSTAFGTSNLASGAQSTVFGNDTLASGAYATAFGVGTAASGFASIAMGQYTSAASYDSLAVGTYNTGAQESGAPTPSLTSWVSTDPLFEIGNGTSSTRSDALVVYKDGIVAVHNKIRTSPGGDLSMGSFTAGTAP